MLPLKATADMAIASLTVGGRVEDANIWAGYDTSNNPANGQACIGPVRVGQNWIASNLVGGCTPGSNGNFGTNGTTPIPQVSFPAKPGLIPTITSILIGGEVLGTPAAVNNTDGFAFVAGMIGSLSVAGTKFPLHPGPGNDFAFVGPTGDMVVLD
jgi:hypothetical protein